MSKSKRLCEEGIRDRVCRELEDFVKVRVNGQSERKYEKLRAVGVLRESSNTTDIE